MSKRTCNHIAYCGDSPNDAPMYAVFPLGIGVANIRPYAKLMAHLPNYVTAGEGGHGFAEFADAVLQARTPMRDTAAGLPSALPADWSSGFSASPRPGSRAA